MNKKKLYNLKLSKLFIIPLASLVILTWSGFTCKTVSEETGVFTFMVNDKVFTLDNMTAVLRTTTGGRKQLSLSNDRFVKFFFIDPKVKDFDLASQASKEAIVRYNEPGTNNIYLPKSGFVKILKLDESSKNLSGEFEMEMRMPGKDKVIKIKQGHFDVPVVVLR